MRIKRLTLSIVMLAVISPNLSFGRSLGQSGGKPIKVEKEWRGEIKQELRHPAPQNCFIANEKAWAKLWRAYRGNEELPKIDFDKQLILVGVSIAPNHLSYFPDMLMLNEKGDLEVVFFSTLIGGLNPTTYRYIFLLIGREGVKSINSESVNKTGTKRPPQPGRR